MVFLLLEHNEFFHNILLYLILVQLISYVAKILDLHITKLKLDILMYALNAYFILYHT